jgi:hypothetical protein
MSLISAHVIIAQHVLIERDNVPSIIRMIDLFSITPDIPRLPDGTLPLIQMQLFINVRFSGDDDDEHDVGFTLRRPDGSETHRDVTKMAAAKSPYPEGDRGLNMAVPLGVNPTHFGKHEVFVTVDGEKVSGTPFLILQMASTSAEAQQ